jgi:hypothetical protein
MILLQTRIGLACLLGLAIGVRADGAPRIEHTPVTVGVRGQPLMVRARVAGPERSVKSVTLFYSTSKDAAPFSVPMQATGAGAYVGTVPGGILATLDRVTYYLAAEDAAGSTAETPWYTVRIQAGAGGAGPAESQRPAWVKPALIGGGVALAAGGVALLLNDSDDDSGGGTPAGNYAGTYTGTSTEGTSVGGGPVAYEQHSVTITISAAGQVQSGDLRTGTTMQTTLSGASFVLSSTVLVEGPDGEIRYIGNVIGERIVGQIQGSAGSGTNTTVFSGNFSAVKQ